MPLPLLDTQVSCAHVPAKPAAPWVGPVVPPPLPGGVVPVTQATAMLVTSPEAVPVPLVTLQVWPSGWVLTVTV